jgi:chemotaxis protein histidine kinase CheA
MSCEPILDYEKFLEFKTESCSGDSEVCSELMNIYLKGLGNFKSFLSEFMKENSIEAFEKLQSSAHSLRPSSLHMGLEKLSKMFIQLENMTFEEFEHSSSNIIKELLVTLDQVRIELLKQSQ